MCAHHITRNTPCSLDARWCNQDHTTTGRCECSLSHALDCATQPQHRMCVPHQHTTGKLTLDVTTPSAAADWHHPRRHTRWHRAHHATRVKRMCQPELPKSSHDGGGAHNTTHPPLRTAHCAHRCHHTTKAHTAHHYGVWLCHATGR